MNVDPKSAAGSAEDQGKTCHFCGVGCQRQFEADPAKYVPA